MMSKYPLLDHVIERSRQERIRQMEKEGWTPEHDEAHDNEELALAGACYLAPAKMWGVWPWEQRYWKPCPNDRKRELEKGIALAFAEYERILRAEMKEGA